ncbi:unnamed protein product [Rhizoctonia solani]|uniref:BTB domain-containing protein n=1 Tax=Rhizoctonia solani TaxID=456999 RepID=A0A8H3BA97_9AGAM|nr:unnamed protein product [Rhizoctonia solani]
MSAELTIIVRGETFTLSEDQIKFEAPSLFTKFLDDHSETPRPPMRFSRNPRLFSLILDYLCGYTILPIHDANVPHGMTRETVLKNLKADATQYELEKLVKLIDEHQRSLVPISAKPQGAIDKSKELLVSTRMSPFFHFPGRLTSLSRYWDQTPIAFMELPFPIDLTKSFTIAMPAQGILTILSLDVPYASTPHELFHISISPDQDFQLEIAVGDVPDDSSQGPNPTDKNRLPLGPSATTTRQNQWNHLAFVQHVGEDGSVDRRTLHMNGSELLRSTEKAQIYNPAPSQTRMAFMRGCWNRKRSTGFLGQIENITLFRRALDQEELTDRASEENKPAVHGGPNSDNHEWDTEAVY